MINSIDLQDYQSHKKSVIQLAKGFTIIVGSNGCGKSSIMRAIKSTAFNTVGISEVRSPDAKQYTVKIDVNGKTVTREKGKGINSYKIDDEEALIDVNRDVPLSVQNVLNIRKIDVDDTTDVSVNFSEQMDAPYLLSLKDSAKMKFLNIISGTHAIDLATKQANAVLQSNKKDEKRLVSELEALEKEEAILVKKLSIIKQANKVIKKHTENIDEMQTLLTTMQTLKTRYEKLHSTYRKIRLIKERIVDIDFNKLLSAIDKYILVCNLKTRYEKLKKSNKIIKNKLRSLCDFDPEKYTTLIDKTYNILTIYNKYSTVLTSMDTLNTKIEAIQTKENECKKEYVNAVRDSKVCPICGNAVTAECVDNITQSL